MRFVTLGMCAAMGLGALAVGCDESSTAPKVDTTAAQSTADKAADAVKDTAAKATDAAKDTADKATAAATDAKEAVADAASDMLAKATKLYDDAKASLTKMPPDLDTAQKYLDELKGWQDKLPADWKAKVDELVKMFNDAKAKLQNVPGMPK